MVINITQNTVIEEETLVEMSLIGEICYVDNVSRYTPSKIIQKLVKNTNLMKFISYKGTVDGLAMYEVSPKVDICICNNPTTYKLFKGDLLPVNQFMEGNHPKNEDLSVLK